MDDTQTPEFGNGREGSDSEHDALDALAAMDPADAPGPAERLAADLAADLEDVGATPADPVQLQVDLDDEPA